MKYLLDVSTLKYDADKCTGCGRCQEVCPHGVFAISDKMASVTDRDLCMECGACMQNCAFGAIEVKTGVGCAAAIINQMLTGELSCDCGPKGNGGSGGPASCC
jgi:NAD-dependent dihydropyrimidine dehydrogenase PreA subunit